MESGNKDMHASAFTLSDFNSTTVLAEKNVENGKDSEYNPFEHRDMTHANSTWGALAHLLKSSLGTGILAMPMAFKNSGILVGVIGTLIVGYICTHCVNIFVKTSQEACRKTKTPSLGFAETAEKVFETGPLSLRKYSTTAKAVCEYSMAGTYLGANCVYIVLIGTSFHDVFNYQLGVNWDLRYYIAFSVLPCIILGEIRQLKYLVPFSAVANVCMVVTLAITFYFTVTGPIEITEKPLYQSWKLFPNFISTVIFAMEGIGTIMPIENSMKKPTHFLGCPGVLSGAMVTVTTLYTLVGFVGYARYGDAVKATITSNLPEGNLFAESAQILIGVAICFTFGLQFYVPMDILWRKLQLRIPKTRHNISQIVFRAGCILIMGAVSVAVPKLGPFISLVGAIFFSFLGLFIPAVVETVFRYPHDLGSFNWVLIKNTILVIFSILSLTTGSYVAIGDIIAEYNK